MRRFGRIKLSFSDAILSAGRLPKSDEIRSDSFRIWFLAVFSCSKIRLNLIRWLDMTGIDGIFSGVIRSRNRLRGIRSNPGRIRQILSRKTSDSDTIRHRIRSFPVGSTGWIESPGDPYLLIFNGLNYILSLR
jgi:hypothetical protein